MLSIMKKAFETPKIDTKKLVEMYKPRDIIVKRIETVEEETKNGKLIRRIEKEVNLTKLINETKKIIKQETAIEKIEAVQQELLNKGVI